MLWTPNATAAVGQLPGTATNDNALAGKVGEIITATLASGSATSLSNAVTKTITSISLTPGDWDINGIVYFVLAGTTVPIYVLAGISTVNNTDPTDPTTGRNLMYYSNTGLNSSVLVGPVRFSVAATTTVYLVGSSSFTTSTMTAHGMIVARRAR